MCGGPQWKREEVPDHKFDFVDTREFTDNGFFMRMKYLFLYLLMLKSFLVYISDIFTATTMLTTDGWSNDIYNSCPADDDTEDCVPIDFNIGKWVFFGCIIFSFLLLAYEAHKSRRIIKSRDISYAFTNVMANHYYSLRSYDHFCFFDHISNSTKRMDDYAFFVFFTFKGWKRLLLADGPRQAINAITLYSFFLVKSKEKGDWDDLDKYFGGRDLIANILMCVMIFTVLIFACSLLLLGVAGVCYVPLLCIIRGNLKEYCCHKVDKRIAEIIRRRNKQRHARAAALAQKEAEGDFSHLKGKTGGALPQPTLPTISLDDDDDNASQLTRAAPPGNFANDNYYGGDQKLGGGGGGYYGAGGQDQYGAEYPQMPGYGYNGQDYGVQGGNYGGGHAYADHSNPSLGTVYGEREPYFNDNAYANSTAHLHPAGEPYEGNGGFDARDGHTQAGHRGFEAPAAQNQRHVYARDEYDDSPSGLAYGEAQDYPSPTSAGPPGRSQQGYQPQAGYDHAYHDGREPPRGGAAGSAGGGYAV